MSEHWVILILSVMNTGWVAFAVDRAFWASRWKERYRRTRGDAERAWKDAYGVSYRSVVGGGS